MCLYLAFLEICNQLNDSQKFNVFSNMILSEHLTEEKRNEALILSFLLWNFNDKKFINEIYRDILTYTIINRNLY